MTRSTTPSRQLEPDRFCAVFGASAGIHAADGRDLCLDHWRELKAAGGAQQTELRAARHDLFGRVA